LRRVRKTRCYREGAKNKKREPETWGNNWRKERAGRIREAIKKERPLSIQEEERFLQIK